MTVHESGVSIIFHSKPFAVLRDFRTAPIEFFGSGLDSVNRRFDSLHEDERNARNVLREIFGDADELESCFMDLEANGAVWEFGFVLNEKLSSSFPPYCMASAAISRLQDGGYRLHGFAAGLRKMRKPEENRSLSSKEAAGPNPDPVRAAALQAIAGESGPIRKVLGEIAKIGKFDTVAFIQGDTGTGKELVAMAVHKLSSRADKPFVAINCGALTETLLDSQLFGHVKGAFTGAETETAGLFEEADGGTIFLDEIGEMSLGTQVKLLRVLQDGTIRKLGSSKSKRVDVRIITATHRNIEDLVRDERFREDLYYRIHVFPIYTPKLSERGDDILMLANLFLREFAASHRKEIGGISDQAAKVLKRHAWPGNVRELRNVIERAVVLCDADILRVEDLLLSFTKKPFSGEVDPPAVPPPGDNPENPKKILDCLEKNHWNKTLTAKDLNISRATLWRKMKELSKSAP